MRDREEHEDREDDKTDQSESEEEDDDNVYMDDNAAPVETPYIRNSTEELGQVWLACSRAFLFVFLKWQVYDNCFCQLVLSLASLFII